MQVSHCRNGNSQKYISNKNRLYQTKQTFSTTIAMTESFGEDLTFCLRRVFHKNDRKNGLEIQEICKIVSDVEEAAVLIKKRSSVSMPNDVDHADIQNCAKAFTLYKCCAYIDDMVDKYTSFSGLFFRRLHMNEQVVQNLSFKIHINYGIPYWYVMRYIWTKLLADVQYNISLEMESEKVVSPSPTDYMESITMMDMIIDINLQKEKRILELPPAPIFSANEILKLQNYVLRLHYMCMQLPEDIARQVYKGGIYANYDIIPKIDKKYEIGTHESCLRCEAARHIVEKGIECGGLEIEIKSAFWISCHLPLNFKL